MSEAARIYQLRVTLAYIDPPIWRQLEIPGDTTFAALHDAMQTVMGWEDCHLWTFYVDKTEVGPPQPAGFDFTDAPRALSATRTTLDQMLSGRRIKFRYIYDMGDDWLHEIKVEKVLAPEAGVQYPRCTGGARACPPEDCGGFPGYQNLLEVMADPKNPDNGETLEWLGEDWDAEAFDINAVNARLKPRRRSFSNRKRK